MELPAESSEKAVAQLIADLKGNTPDWVHDNPRLNPKILCAIEKQELALHEFLKNKKHSSMPDHHASEYSKMILPGVLFDRRGREGETSCHSAGVSLAEKVAQHLDPKNSNQDQAPVYVWNQRIGGMAYVAAYWNVTQRSSGEQRQICIQFAPGDVSDFSALADIFNDPTVKDFESTVRVIDHIDAMEFIHCVEKKRGVLTMSSRWISVFL